MLPHRKFLSVSRMHAAFEAFHGSKDFTIVGERLLRLQVTQVTRDSLTFVIILLILLHEAWRRCRGETAS